MNCLFSSFDVFPSAKGAGAHIYHTIRAISKITDSATIYCLGSPEMPAIQKENNISIHRSLSNHPNFLKRVEYFDKFLYQNMNNKKHGFDIVHFRDIWSGIALSMHPKNKDAKFIYEVNGFASIELPLRYPHLLNNKNLIKKIRNSEDILLERADKIITVSQVNTDYIVKRGVARNKITIIPNSASILENIEEVEVDKDLILYVGTLSPWQGLPVLLEALKMLSLEKKLFIASSTKKHLKHIKKHIRKLGLEERVQIGSGLDKESLKNMFRKAYFSVAPLTRCDRNELQGCCPIKIIESMAEKTPVIASNISVNRELITDNENGILFTPDSPRSLAVKMEILFSDNSKRDFLALNGFEHIKKNYNISDFDKALELLYRQLV